METTCEVPRLERVAITVGTEPWRSQLTLTVFVACASLVDLAMLAKITIGTEARTVNKLVFIMILYAVDYFVWFPEPRITA